MTIKFTECLNDLWDYFFLGDPENLSDFQSQHQLGDDLIHAFTTSDDGDKVVEKGVLIPMSGIANYPYHIFFQINNSSSVFSDPSHDLQFEQSGYVLQVINEEIYLMTLPYLKKWTQEDGIGSLKTNGVRPKVSLENSWYQVMIRGGETHQENTGWEPTIEFILTKTEEGISNVVEDVNFQFHITARDY